MDLIKKYSQLALSELTEAFAEMKQEDIDPLIKEIHQAGKIFLLGGGREGLSTKAFAMRIAHLGKEAHWVWDDTATSMTTGDLFIVACGNANVSTTNKVVENAKKTGAKIALFTCATAGPCVDLADLIIPIPAASYKATGDLIYSKQLMGNLFEQMLFILYDIIIMAYCDTYSITPDQLEQRHRNVE